MELKIGASGQVALPGDVCQRYGLKADTPMRLIETENAIVLVPLTAAPVGEALEKELLQWQSHGAEAWDLFPYSEDDA